MDDSVSEAGTYVTSYSGTDILSPGVDTWGNASSITLEAGRWLVIGKMNGAVSGMNQNSTFAGKMYQYVGIETLDDVTSKDIDYATNGISGLDGANPVQAKTLGASAVVFSLVVFPITPSQSTKIYQHFKFTGSGSGNKVTLHYLWGIRLN